MFSYKKKPLVLLQYDLKIIQKQNNHSPVISSCLAFSSALTRSLQLGCVLPCSHFEQPEQTTHAHKGNWRHLLCVDFTFFLLNLAKEGWSTSGQSEIQKWKLNSKMKVIDNVWCTLLSIMQYWTVGNRCKRAKCGIKDGLYYLCKGEVKYGTKGLVMIFWPKSFTR